MNFARSILNVAEKLGLAVFPSFNENWHFDDKVSETYLLQSINAPIPKSWIFHTKQDLNNWLRSEVEFPVVAKLKSGSGSNNVNLIHDLGQIKKYSNKMFRKGFSPAPKLSFKASSNFKSSKSMQDIKYRIKKIPQFLNTMKLGKELPNEKGYVYFQEYISNPGYDLKVVTVGNKASFVGRKIRKNDFRASGGGDLIYDKSLISNEVLELAFGISEKLGFSCMGYDFIYDNKNNKWVIVEISYGFSHVAQINLGGYWDRDFKWHTRALNAPNEILENIIKQKITINEEVSK
jgi:glutathione synthase/RimK-type ligase-like ATP-grasp enzyme